MPPPTMVRITSLTVAPGTASLIARMLGERERHGVEHAVRADLAVEARLGRHAGVAERHFALGRLAGEPADAGQRAPDRFHPPHRLLERIEVAERASRSAVEGIASGFQSSFATRVVMFGVEVVDRGRHLDPAHAVDRGVVHLADQREAAGREPLDIVEPLDDREFPQRLRQVHRPRVQPRDLDAQLPPVAGLGQRDVADVEFDVELGILDPIGMIDVERHAHQPLPERARARQPALDEVQYVLEPHEPAGRGRRVVDRRPNRCASAYAGFRDRRTRRPDPTIAASCSPVAAMLPLHLPNPNTS